MISNKPHALLFALVATLVLTLPCRAAFVNMWIVMYDCNPAGLPGYKTYRVYCRFSDPGDRLTGVIGTSFSPATISGSFYQSPFGGTTAPDAATIASHPEARFDTFCTIGVAVDDGTDHTYTSFPFPRWPVFNNTNMGWFVPPSSYEQGAPDFDHLVLIAQLTCLGGGPLISAGITYIPAGSSTAVGAYNISPVLLPLTAGDVNHDLMVNIDDLVLIITNWTNTGPGIPDANDDGVINIDDLVLVITHWGLFTGSCP